MKEWLAKNGLKLASGLLTLAGVALGFGEQVVKNKQDEQRIADMVAEYMEENFKEVK